MKLLVPFEFGRRQEIGTSQTAEDEPAEIHPRRGILHRNLPEWLVEEAGENES